MSNKITLQTNNTNLASYTDRVTALISVANNLPAAGSGDGSQIYTGTISLAANADRVEMSGYLSYINVDEEYVQPSFDSNGIEISLLKGSVLWIYDPVDSYTGLELISHDSHRGESIFKPTQDRFNIVLTD